MVNIIIGIISIIISSFVLLYNRKFFKSLSNNNLLKFIEFLIYYKVFFYLLVPSVLRIFSDFQYETELGINPMELLIVYIFEVISYIIWITIFYAIIYKYRNTTLNKNTTKKVEQIYVFILILFIYLTIINTIKIFGLDLDFNNYFESIFYIIFPLVNTLGPVLAFFGIIYYKYDNPNNKLFLLSIFAVLFYFITVLISGVRGLIVHPLFFVIFLLHIYGKKRQIKLTFILLFGFAIFQATYMQIRHLDTDTKIEILAQGNLEKENKNIFDDIELRYGESSRMSVAFLRRGLDNNFAGLKPFLSSLYAPLPRTLFPKKPIPGSIGEDKYSMGGYLIMSDLRGQWWNMTEFLTSAHAYWEFGIIGLIIITIISVLYISLIVRFLLKIHVLGIPIILLFFKPWGYNEPKIWLYEIPLQIFQYIIPGLTIFFVLKLIYAFKKLIVKNLN